MREDPLGDVTVIDLSTGVAGAFGARMLADWGARVIKVEPPEGDVTRKMEPLSPSARHPEQSAWFLFLNANKSGITLRVAAPQGRAVLDHLLERADILVHDMDPKLVEQLGLQYERLEPAYPRLVVTWVRPFGSTGPYAGFKATDITLQAMSGFMALNGDPQREPLQVPGETAALVAGWNVALAAMMGLLFQRAQGQGQLIELSEMECLLSQPPFHLLWYAYAGGIESRGRGYPKRVVDGDVQECGDGWIVLTADGGNPWEMFAVFFDEPRLLDERFRDRHHRWDHWEEIQAILASKLKSREKMELFRSGLQERFVFGPVQSLEEVLRCRHLAERGSFQEVEHPVAGRLKEPGPGFSIAGSPVARRAAPLLGQHNEEVYLQWLGYSREELAVFRRHKVV